MSKASMLDRLLLEPYRSLVPGHAPLINVDGQQRCDLFSQEDHVVNHGVVVPLAGLLS